MRQAGLGNYSQKLAQAADFAAQTAAWEDKNAFATHQAGLGGAFGGNPGFLSPGQKPADVVGSAMHGQLGSAAEQAARYAGTGFLADSSRQVRRGNQVFGHDMVMQNWGGGFSHSGAWVRQAGLNDSSSLIQQVSNGDISDLPGVPVKAQRVLQPLLRGGGN
jgi:hypothetical protein